MPGTAVGTRVSYQGQDRRKQKLVELRVLISLSGSSEELIKLNNRKKGDARLDRVKAGEDLTCKSRGRAFFPARGIIINKILVF